MSPKLHPAVKQSANRMLAQSDSQFVSAVMKRLRAGAVEYGDASLKKSPNEFVREIKEELLDVVGWVIIFKAAHPALPPSLDATIIVAADVVEEMVIEIENGQIRADRDHAD